MIKSLGTLTCPVCDRRVSFYRRDDDSPEVVRLFYHGAGRAFRSGCPGSIVAHVPESKPEETETES